MSKPKLIACALAGVLAAGASHAQEPPVTTAPANVTPAPPWAAPQPRPAPALPAWVKERRAQLGIEEAPTVDATEMPTRTGDAGEAPFETATGSEPSGMPSKGSYERPAVPDWVIEQRAEMAQQARPEPPARPAAPQPPEWVKPNPPAAPAGPGAMPPMREVSDAPAGPTWVIERPAGATSDQEAIDSPETGAVARLAIDNVPEAPARPEPPTRPELPEAPAAVADGPGFTPSARPEMARLAPPQAPTWAERPAPMQAPDAPTRPPRPEQHEINAAMPAPAAPQSPDIDNFAPAQQPAWAGAMPDPLAMAAETPTLPEVMPPAPGPAMYPAPWGGGYGGYPGGGYPGWGYPGGGWGNGWMPWSNSGWGNGWMPWGSGWGNGWGNDWMPWGSGWGNDWNDGYGVGDGWGGLGGDGYGGGSGEADFSFAMSGSASADMTGQGHGDGYGDGWGRGWGHKGYGYPGYGYAPYPYPMMPVLPDDGEYALGDEGPADGDADGIVDASDLCPDTAEGMTVDALGCDIEARIVLQGVNFKTDSDELTESSLTILDGVSATLSAHPEIRVVVAGHTDSDGEDAYNKDLSQRRAQRVVDYLSDNGVESSNLVARGFGEEQPIANNDTAEGKAANRRVELKRL